MLDIMSVFRYNQRSEKKNKKQRLFKKKKKKKKKQDRTGQDKTRQDSFIRQLFFSENHTTGPLFRYTAWVSGSNPQINPGCCRLRNAQTAALRQAHCPKLGLKSLHPSWKNNNVGA